MTDRSAGPDACWPFTGYTTTKGYGRIRVPGRRSAQAHRVAWEVAHGRSAGKRLVRHTCDNPPCVNPAHLRLGTAAQNSADMVRRGRSLSGEKRQRSKRADRAIARRKRAVREDAAVRLYLDGWTQDAVAAEYGWTSGTVSRLLARKGVPARPSKVRTDVDAAEVERHWRAGLGSRAIATTLGVPRSAVISVISEAGLRRRPGRVKGIK
jgi:DNA-directed RNA polymerase specialized sigma24 family protein